MFWDWINDYAAAIGAVTGAVAAIVAIVTLTSTASSSKARSQPMVTAEFRPAPDSESSFEFVVTNHGVTPARDLRVTFSPEIPAPADATDSLTPFLIRRYAKPIPVLSPGQALSNTWWAGRPGPNNEWVNDESTPDEVMVAVSYKGLGWRRLHDSFELTIETITLTTWNVDSTSTKGRLQSFEQSLRQIRDHLATIARKVS